MKKFIFIILSLFLTMCDSTNIELNESNSIFNKFITETVISAELVAENSGNVELIISNNSEEDFFISKGDIPLENFERDVFKISTGQEMLPYIGRFFYKKIQNDDWVQINAGDSLDVSIYLPLSYDFQKEDYHETYFKALISVRFLDESIETFNVISNTVDLVVDEEAVSFRPYRPDMKPCSSSEISNLNKGKNLSLGKVNNARAYLDQKKADSYYTKWFGSYTNSRFNIVTTGFDKMRPAHQQNWSYSCETKANGGCNGWAAYVYKGQPYKVWVCMDYYSKTSDENRGSLMTHEASHWDVTFGADDHGYGYNTGINLAKSDPDKAIDCANNIEYYTWDIPKVGDGPDPPDPNGGPAGYTKCADEHQSFTLPGICNVAYGAKGIFAYKYNVKGTITFNNATFGDPVPGVFKAGYYKQVGTDPDPDPNSPVIVYQHDNYGGWSASLKVDNYNINKMIATGAQNDNISSIKVKTGYKAIVYEHKDFGGISHTITKNISSLRTLNFNDKISSIKVQKAGTDPDPDPPVNGDSIGVDHIMKPGDRINSAQKKYRFVFRKTGNLILRDNSNGSIIWKSGTGGKGGAKFLLQGDGNLVLYTDAHKPLWASGTDGKRADKFQVLDSGHIVIKNGNTIIWSKPGNTPDPPDPDPTGAWKFVVAGDTRTSDSSHRSVLRAVMNNSRDYHIYLNSGDVVADGGSSSQWNTFRNATSSILGSDWQSGSPPKYIACPGNHDRVMGSGLSNWNGYLSNQAKYRDKGRNFSFKYKNATFIVLDADKDKSSMVSFIKNTVANAGTTWIFAMWHYDSTYSQWINALGKFDGVFHGHRHVYERRNKGSYFSIVVGTGGAPLGSGATYGYLECIVDGNKMTVRYRKASNGVVLDSATYTANSK